MCDKNKFRFCFIFEIFKYEAETRQGIMPPRSVVVSFSIQGIATSPQISPSLSPLLPALSHVTKGLILQLS